MRQGEYFINIKKVQKFNIEGLTNFEKKRSEREKKKRKSSSL